MDERLFLHWQQRGILQRFRVMHVLWETGPANVQTVQKKLKSDLAYTTVQTMLNILERKGKAKRTLKNRAYFYKPAVSRKQVVGKVLRSETLPVPVTIGLFHPVIILPEPLLREGNIELLTAV